MEAKYLVQVKVGDDWVNEATSKSFDGANRRARKAQADYKGQLPVSFIRDGDPELLRRIPTVNGPVFASDL